MSEAAAVPETKTETPAPAAAPAAPEMPDKKAASTAGATLRLLREKSDLQKQREAFAKEKAQREADLAAKQSQLEKESQDFAAWKKAKDEKNPLKLIQSAGLPPDEVAKFLLSGGKPPDEKDAKFAELEGKLSKQEEEFKKLIEAQTSAAKERENEMREEARQEVHADLSARAKDFPWINALGQHDEVLKELAAQHEKTGEMDLDAAAKTVNDRLRDGMKNYVRDLLKHDEVRALFAEQMAALAAAAEAKTETSEDKPVTEDPVDSFSSFWKRKESGTKEVAAPAAKPAPPPKPTAAPDTRGPIVPRKPADKADSRSALKIWQELVNRT